MTLQKWPVSSILGAIGISLAPANGCFAKRRPSAMGTYAENPVMQSDSYGHAFGSCIRLDHMANSST